MTARATERPGTPGVDVRYTLGLAGSLAVGLACAYLAAPERADLISAAAVGGSFAAAAGIAGNELVRRFAAESPAKGLQAFLAVMTAKMLAFAAFLMTIAFLTPFNIPALAIALAGTTLMGELLAIDGLRRMGAGNPHDPEPAAAAGNRSREMEEDGAREA